MKDLKLPFEFEDEELHSFSIRVFQNGNEYQVEIRARTLNDAIDEINAQFGINRSIIV